MLFSDVIGHADIKRHLVDMVQRHRLSHALLFVGKEGSGALDMARAFAQFVVCEKGGSYKDTVVDGASLFGEALPAPEKSTDACGVCPACIKAAQNIHPDIHYSFPVIRSANSTSDSPPVSKDFIVKWRTFLQEHPEGNVYDWLQYIGAENRQGNITKAECSTILHDMSLKSFESPYKILIMWMPEYLEKEGNRLLKLIEEPPANTLFIFVAESYERILPTILSRCQLIKIPSPEDHDIENALITKAHIPAESAARIARLSDGNYRVALQLALDSGDEDWQHMLRDWLNAVFMVKHKMITKWADDMSKLGREKQKHFLKYFNQLLEQCLRLRYIGEACPIYGAEKEMAQKLNQVTSVSQQEAIIAELDKAAYYIERNAQTKLLFHALSIQLLHIIKDKALILTD